MEIHFELPQKQIKSLPHGWCFRNNVGIAWKSLCHGGIIRRPGLGLARFRRKGAHLIPLNAHQLLFLNPLVTTLVVGFLVRALEGVFVVLC